VPALKIDGMELKAEDPLTCAASADCTVVVTDHTSVDYEQIVDAAKLVLDTRNALKRLQSDKIVRL
jgi:UDP-N-acetyl-D-glucosamine dehydrogenase